VQMQLRRQNRELAHLESTQRRLAQRLIDAQAVAKVGSWETDLATLDVTWTVETHRIFGTDPASFQPTHARFLELVHPEDRPAVEDAFRASLAHTEPCTIAHRVCRADGEERVVEERWQVFRDARGQPVRAVGTSRDITVSKQLEERLAEQAALIDQAHDAFVVRGLDNRIAFWSRGAERVYGWTAAEVAGKNFLVVLQPDAAVFQEALRATLANGEWNGEISKLHQDGRKLLIQARWTLMRDAAGQPRAILTIDTDVTERRQIEQQFLRAQRMESIGTLAGGIAHDLNNLLAPITMGVELLRRAELSDSNLRVVENIDRSARRGASLVRQVLSFARGVEGQRVPLQARHIAREIEEIVENTFPKNISFEAQVPGDLWLISGDPTQIHQVLLNLCVNARDAEPGGG
jgi:PAS domain S-box-containing protein